MAILSVSGISRSFGGDKLFDNVSFCVNAGDKIGFIGSNGTGKTTLFRLLTGDDRPDSGTIIKSEDCTIGYMRQHTVSESDKCLYDEVLSVFSDLLLLESRQEKTVSLIEEGVDTDRQIERQHRLSVEYERLGGLTYKSYTRSTLLGLGFSENDLSLPVSALSGGEKTRAALAKLLLGKSPLLLLDEPTNHLDMNAVAFLEDFLVSYKGAVIVISHDRYFLDKATKKTLELSHKRVTFFDAPYSAYFDFKQKTAADMQKHYENDMKEIRRIEGIIAQQRQWNRERNIKTAESKQKMLDKKVAALERPEASEQKVHFSFSPKRESGNDVLFLSNVGKSFDSAPLFKNAAMDIKKGEKVFLLGSNGAGKTTLLNIIAGRLKPDEGTLRFGASLDLAYYEQLASDISGKKTVVEQIRDAHPLLSDTEIRNHLAAFLFRGEDVFKQLDVLSGGEKARVSLLSIMLSSPNFLLLDEPTNHLDIASREVLENALLSYSGTILAVSHDRYFINKLATTIYEISSCGTHKYAGNYDYYLQKTTEEGAKGGAAPKKTNSYLAEKEQRARLRKMENELKKAEASIAQKEELIAGLEQELEETGSDYQRAALLASQLEEENRILSELYETWETLADL